MSKFVDSILGHAVGDAMGVPTEFCIREHLLKNPVVEMIGSKKVGQPAGSWSDDTSMEIATIESLIKNKKFDYSDIMSRWCDWLNNGEYTPNGVTFDVGRTCLKACRNYTNGDNPTECGLSDINSNGNGSLMRILPVALYSYSKHLSNDKIMSLSNEVSSLTHSHNISKIACYMYVKFLINLLNGMSKESAYEYLKLDDYSKYDEESISKYDRLIKEDISDLKINDIKSAGYVVDTWECALWILLNSKSYKEAIIASTNIGNDTDTIGAIVGSMAGIIYGYNSIPEKWLNSLKKRDYLIDLSINFERTFSTLKKDVILGTAIGDIAGSRFEINNCKDKKNFILLHDKHCRFTDDTVMTFAVAKALLEYNGTLDNLKNLSINSMVEVGRKYLNCGFGPSFYQWIKTDNHEPYGSFGNGSAMRISAVPVVIKNINELKAASSIITNVSHNNEDSIKGTEAVCFAINMALNNKTKEEIKEYIEENYFKLDSSVKELSESSDKAIINCVETVKNSLIAFLESYDFEDAIRNAICIGGDSDTIGAITGSIASAYYGIPDDIYNHSLEFLDDYLKDIHSNFWEKYGVI